MIRLSIYPDEIGCRIVHVTETRDDLPVVHEVFAGTHLSIWDNHERLQGVAYQLLQAAMRAIEMEHYRQEADAEMTADD